MKTLLSTGIICDLISVHVQSQIVGSSKQNIILRILGNLKKIEKIVINFKKFATFFKINLTEIIINY